MIGLIVTGHGNFAEGIHDATEMIAGAQENYKKVLFKESMSLDSLEEELKKAIDLLLESNQGVVILTDLKGGTPFNVSALLSEQYENVEVISGINLPISIEATMHSQIQENPLELANYLADVGRTGIDVPNLSSDEDSNDDEFEGDGI